MNCACSTVCESNITAYVNSSFMFFKFTFNFSSVLIAFHHLFTWIALDDVDLHFSLNAMAFEEGTK